MSEALAAGISRRSLYALRDSGTITQLSRGVYRLTSLPELEAPDIVTVATRVPNGVVCLISALAFHELTTQIPHAVDIALARGAERPRIDYPPVSYHWFSGAAFTSGIETPVVDGKRIMSAGKCSDPGQNGRSESRWIPGPTPTMTDVQRVKTEVVSTHTNLL